MLRRELESVLDLGCGGGTFRYADFPSLKIHAIDAGIHEMDDVERAQRVQ